MNLAKMLLSLGTTMVIFSAQAKMCKKKENYKSHDSVAAVSEKDHTYTCEYTQSGALGKDEKNITCKYDKDGKVKSGQDKICKDSPE